MMRMKGGSWWCLDELESDGDRCELLQVSDDKTERGERVFLNTS